MLISCPYGPKFEVMEELGLKKGDAFIYDDPPIDRRGTSVITHGVEVVGTDYNKELVATLNAGQTTFKEDGLDELFQEARCAGEQKLSVCHVPAVRRDYERCVTAFFKIVL